MSETGFRELIRSNDAVLLSFAEALLKERGIEFMSTDFNMSVLEGSIGVLQRRLLVVGDRYVEAERLMKDAGLTAELRRPSDGE